MPVYTYRCPKCGKTNDNFQHHCDTEEISCPDCHVLMMRLFPAPPVIFKGSGWTTASSYTPLIENTR